MGYLAFVFAIYGLSSSTWANPRSWSPATDCRANIRAVTCRVAPQSKNQENDPRILRPCLGDEASFITELQKVHDELPPKLRKMFCHLRKIYIEEEFYATAYASRFIETYRDEKSLERVRLKGNILGLSRQKVFESKHTLSEWLNRKEQTLFGMKMEDPLSPEIPQLDYQYIGVKANPLLIDVVIHEFGHLLDSAHRFVKYETPFDDKCLDDDNNSPECKPRLTGLWASIGWSPDGTIRPEDRYFGDYAPCYYDCPAEKQLHVSQAVPLYRAFIAKSSFVSVYASVDAAEDFAETFLFYISGNYLSPANSDAKYFISSVRFPGQSEGTNLSSIKAHGRVSAKLNFMAMFDATKWKYESRSSWSATLDEYMKRRPHLNRRACH
jgi:hypothetical protein